MSQGCAQLVLAHCAAQLRLSCKCSSWSVLYSPAGDIWPGGLGDGPLRPKEPPRELMG